MKRTALAITLLVPLLSLITVQFTDLATADPFAIPMQYLPTIYIKNDGTINPATTLIQRVGDVYTFTGNIVNYTIIVQRDNIIIDGSGYTLQTNYPDTRLGWGWGDDDAITISDRSNVTIQNIKIKGFSQGINVANSSHNNITGNYIVECNYPIWFTSSSYNNITKNNITGNIGEAIILSRSHNNSVTNNSIAKNRGGISLSFSSNNKIVGNDVTYNTNGVGLSDASNNFFYLNNFVNNTNQVYIWAKEEVSNIWDNGEVGNFWSNYNGTDANGDGVGDTPFIVETPETVNIFRRLETFGANQQDSFPLMEWYVGQKLPLPTNVQHSIEVYVIVFAVLSTIISTGLFVYFKKRNH